MSDTAPQHHPSLDTDAAAPGDAAQRRPRGRPRAPEADAAILDAALELFVERGVEGTSIEQVAKRASVAKLTVYRRWNSKEDLIAQALESARLRLTEAAELPGDQADDVPVRTLIAASLPVAAETLAQPELRALIARALGVTASHPELARIYWEHHSMPRRRVTHKLLKRAKREGIISQNTDCDVLIDMINGAVVQRLLRPNPPNADELHDYLTALYRQAGLLA